MKESWPGVGVGHCDLRFSAIVPVGKGPREGRHLPQAAQPVSGEVQTQNSSLRPAPFPFTTISHSMGKPGTESAR